MLKFLQRCFHSIRFCLRLSKLISQDLSKVLRSAASCREDISTELRSAVAAGNFQKVKAILEKNVSHLDENAICQVAEYFAFCILLNLIYEFLFFVAFIF